MCWTQATCFILFCVFLLTLFLHSIVFLVYKQILIGIVHWYTYVHITFVFR